jgi:hypothetical protein
MESAHRQRQSVKRMVAVMSGDGMGVMVQR